VVELTNVPFSFKFIVKETSGCMLDILAEIVPE
jgi:hypothetical protein